MAKKLLQTKELIRDLMIDAFKYVLPEVKELQSFPMLVDNIILSKKESSDFELKGDFYWLWLLPSKGAIIYSRYNGFCYLYRQPEKFTFLHDTTKRALEFNTYVVRSYAYKRPNKFLDCAEPIVDFTGVAVEYQFTNTFAQIPEYFEVLEAEVLEDVDEKKKFLDSWKNAGNELEGFEIPVSLNGFILEADYEYYKNLVSNIDFEQLQKKYRDFDYISNPVDLENGIDYSKSPACDYFGVIKSLKKRLKDTGNAHLTAYLGKDCEIRFPCFKNMEGLLSRRDELFASSKSDEEIKAFVHDYNNELLRRGMEVNLSAKAIITGYDAENRIQIKLFSSYN